MTEFIAVIGQVKSLKYDVESNLTWPLHASRTNQCETVNFISVLWHVQSYTDTPDTKKKLIEQKNVWLFEYKIIYLIYDWNLRTLIIHNNMYNIWIHCNFCFHFNCSFNFSSGVIFFHYLSYLYAYIDLFIIFISFSYFSTFSTQVKINKN